MRCSYHADREPVGVCVECGRFICMECKALLGGKMYCTPCADKKFVLKGTEPVIAAAGQQTAIRATTEKIQPTENDQAAAGNQRQQLINVLKETAELKQRQTTDNAAGQIKTNQVKTEAVTRGQAKQEVDGALKQRKMKAKAYGNRMWRGALGLIVGIIITVVSYSVEVIPVTVVAWGFIVLGLYWLFSGLFGWLKYRT
jgi:hypothetical protein